MSFSRPCRQQRGSREGVSVRGVDDGGGDGGGCFLFRVSLALRQGRQGRRCTGLARWRRRRRRWRRRFAGVAGVLAFAPVEQRQQRQHGPGDTSAPVKPPWKPGEHKQREKRRQRRAQQRRFGVPPRGDGVVPANAPACDAARQHDTGSPDDADGRSGGERLQRSSSRSRGIKREGKKVGDWEVGRVSAPRGH